MLSMTTLGRDAIFGEKYPTNNDHHTVRNLAPVAKCNWVLVVAVVARESWHNSEKKVAALGVVRKKNKVRKDEWKVAKLQNDEKIKKE